MPDLSDDDLVRLKELAEKATPGEWLCEGRTVYALNERGFNRMWLNVQDAHADPGELRATATYIQAVQPQAILSLLSRIEQLGSEVSALTKSAVAAGLKVCDLTETLRELDVMIFNDPQVIERAGKFRAHIAAALSSTPATPSLDRHRDAIMRLVRYLADQGETEARDLLAKIESSTPATPSRECEGCAHRHYVQAHPLGTSRSGWGCALTGGHADKRCGHFTPSREPIERSFANELGNEIRITISGPHSVSENTLTRMEAAQLRDALNEALPSSREPSEADVERVARPLSEWHEDIGDVLWWSFPIEEPPYVGSPLDLGRTIRVEVDGHEFTPTIGGWPGYHTHWTRISLPTPPASSDGAALDRARTP